MHFAKFAVALLTAVITLSSGSNAAPVTAPGYHIVNRIPMIDGWWDYAYFEPAYRRLFVVRESGVFKLDVDKSRQDFRALPGTDGRAIAALPGGDVMLSTLAGENMAVLYAPADGKVVKIFHLRQKSDSIVWEPVSKRFWVMGDHGESAALDPVTLKQTGTVNLGETLEFSQVDGKGRVYVNGVESGAVLVFDAPSRKVIGRWKMDGCDHPSGMAYVDVYDIILSVCGNKMLKVLDGRNGAELATVPVGTDADAVIYDSVTKRAFIPSAGDGLLTVVAVNGPRDVRVVEQVPTQYGTRTGAIDPKTGTLYLPTARFAPPDARGHEEALPGTVELLVMRPN